MTATWKRSKDRPRGSGPLAALLVVTLLGAACSDDDGGNRTTPQPSAPSSTGPSGPASTGTPASPAPPTEPSLADVRVELTLVAEVERPTAMAVRAGDEALYVAEQEGRVRVVRDGRVAAEPLVDISDDVTAGGERGLLGLTFSPDGGLLYLSYTNTGGDTRLIELRMAGDAVDPGTRREVLAVDQPFPNHNGGNVLFGPDGFLYLGLGDGGSGGDPLDNGQDRSTLLGDVLRIDPLDRGDGPYAIPADNPFVGDEGSRAEIYVWGLRNPWRFSFDRATGDLWIADVGQGAIEEVTALQAGEAAGANLGWNRLEGSEPYEGSPPADAVGPIFEYPNEAGACAVTGGYVYRGSRIPALAGAYVFADYCAGEVRALVARDGAVVEERELGPRVGSLSSFGEDADGELYVLSLAGTVHRIDPA